MTDSREPRNQIDDRSQPLPLDAFRYLSAVNVTIYCRILQAFVNARDGFRLQLRPSEVAEALSCDGQNPVSEDALIPALNQLRIWGNLTRQIDRAQVQTIEQFNRPSYLYCLSGPGLATEQALNHFHELLDQPGRLDRRALQKVHERLRALVVLLEDTSVDLSKVQDTISVLTQEFEDLTEEAQTFLLSLQSSVELQTLDLQTFLAYKERLIHYLEDFIHELLLTTPRIVELLQAIDDTRIAPALDGLTDHDMEHNTQPKPGDAETKRRRWENRWQGVRQWFTTPQEQGERRLSQAGELRNRAQRAIPALLQAVQSINDRRSARTDRATDLKSLARFFLDAPDDHHAHTLWRAATGLHSARHLHLDTETLTARQERPVPHRTPWADAPPLQLTVTLRRTGRAQKRGAGPGVIDRQKDREKLRHAAEQEAKQLALARAQLLNPEPRRLSDFEPLSLEAFGELLELLGRALAQRVSHDEPTFIHSTDGSLAFDLKPVGGGATATLHTPTGTLTGPDYWVHIRYTDTTSDPLLEAETQANITGASA